MKTAKTKPAVAHIIPVGGNEPAHRADADCWCYPAPVDGISTVLAHNARDCRERLERQGKKAWGAWITVEE